MPHTDARPPKPFDWLIAALRGLHPLRWLTCLIGLALSVVFLAVLQGLLRGEAPRILDWIRQPAEESQALFDTLRLRSVGSLVVRLVPFAILVCGLWSLIAGMIARHEAIARRHNDPYSPESPPVPSALGVLRLRLKDFVIVAPMLLAILGMVLIPQLLASWASNWLGGVGAIIAALLLPIVLIANLVLIAMALGILSSPLMSAAIGIEASDLFDGLSRGFNYFYMRPIIYLVFLLLSLTVSLAPLAGTLFLVAGDWEHWPGASGHVAVWLAAGLSLSIYWSLNSMMYLHLRTMIDQTDAREFGSSVPTPPAAPNPSATNSPPASPAEPKLTISVLLVVLIAATWLTTALLMNRWGGEHGNWLMWGLGQGFTPETEGLHSAAALIGLLWGIAWLLMPVVVQLRRLLVREDAAPPSAGV